MLKGRILTSGDSPLPFLATLSLALILPGGFLAFNADWLWHDFHGAGGKVVLFGFVYITLIMWTNMLRAVWTDPGICERHLVLFLSLADQEAQQCRAICMSRMSS